MAADFLASILACCHAHLPGATGAHTHVHAGCFQPLAPPSYARRWHPGQHGAAPRSNQRPQRGGAAAAWVSCSRRRGVAGRDKRRGQDGSRCREDAATAGAAVCSMIYTRLFRCMCEKSSLHRETWKVRADRVLGRQCANPATGSHTNVHRPAAACMLDGLGRRKTERWLLSLFTTLQMDSLGGWQGWHSVITDEQVGLHRPGRAIQP